MAELDNTEARSVVAFLAKAGRQPDDMLRFFDRKDYFCLVGRDAETVAVEYFKSTACIKSVQQGGERRSYLSINKKMASEVMRAALLSQRRRVEVYRPDKSSWVLQRRGSPGNLQAFETECGLDRDDASADTSPIIVAVSIGKTAGSKGYAGNGRLVGVAFIDSTVRSIRMSEFEDDEHFSSLESFVCQQGTKECLLPAELQSPEQAKLAEVLQLCEVPLTQAARGSFGTKDAEQDLQRLLGKAELHGRCFECAQKLALSSCCGLVKYLQLMGSTESHGQWTVEWVDAAHHVRLDAGAMRALSVDPVVGEPDKNASLLGVFSHCKTAMGSRLVRKWLRQPLLSAHDIEARLTLVQAFASSLELRSSLRDEVLSRMGSDLDRLARRLAARKGSLQDVVSLYYFVQKLPRLLQALQAHEGAEEEQQAVRDRFTAPLQEAHGSFEQLLNLVETAIDLEAARRHEFVLHASLDPSLRDLGVRKEEAYDEIASHYEEMQGVFGLDEGKLKLEHSSQWGYVLRVTRKDEKVVRENKKACKDVTFLQTKKEGVLFRGPQLAGLAEDYLAVQREYQAAQAEIAKQVVEMATTYTPVVQDCVTLLAELDVLLCFAHVSMTAPEPYVRPKLVPPQDARQRIVLRGCRHPCVERMEEVSFIKNDTELVSGESSLQVVTGPNMGGKSTYIRAVGVNVLLAQVGCFVPCDEAEISVVDSILARVGAGDCQARGVSTFMAEMLETATILKCATPRSLVIIDELGRGTSTYDGFGLAWAISEHLATKVGCPTLFATHFHELTEMAQIQPMVVNRHVSALIADGQLTMLFRVEDGPSDQSFGVHVAEVARFPAQVVAAAKRKLAELEDNDSVHTQQAAQRCRAAVSEAERAEGLQLVRGFLDEFAALPLEEGGEEEAQQRLAELQGRLRASDNPLVAQLCAQ